MEPNTNLNDKPSPKLTIKSFLNGKYITESLSSKHIVPMIIVFFVLIFYIWNRYESQRQMTYIAVLNKQLRELRYRAVTHSSEVMGQSKQSQIKLKLNQLGLDLVESQNPPYTLD
ncbi:MAG: FtsL-like putative cell division protein [Bacteroidales bacterium]